MMLGLGQIGGRLYRGEVSFNFVGRRRLWYTISAFILVVSIVAVIVRGLSFSVDFKGGAIFTFPSSSTSLSQVQNAVESDGISGAIVQQTHGDKNGWQIQTKALTGAQTVALERTLSSKLGVNSDQINVTTVGPSWGSQISGKALEALIAFMIVIVIYLSIAFELRMAIAAFVALVHDLVIATGLYALAGFQVSPATVIGLLTILGYSLYDTVVVFDKVRENTAGLLGGARTTYSQARITWRSTRPWSDRRIPRSSWGDEVSEMRMFSVADQRSIPEISVDYVVAVACRELLLTDDVRARAAELAGHQPAPEHGVTGGVGDMLAKLAEGIPVDGMEALLPVLRPDGVALLDRSTGRRHAGAGLRPGKGPHPRGRPDQDRPRIPRRVVVGGRGRRRFADRRRATRRIGLPRTRRGARCCAAVRAPVVDAVPAVRRVGDRTGHPRRSVGARPSARYRRDLRDAARARGDRRGPPPSSRPVPEPRIASSSSWPNPTRRQRCWSREPSPNPASSACSRAHCTTAWSSRARTW